MVGAIASVFAKRIDRSIAAHLRLDERVYSRLCEERRLKAESGIAWHLSDCSDSSSLDAVPHHLNPPTATHVEFARVLDFLSSKAEEPFLVRILKGVGQPLTVLFRHFPPHLHALLVESKVTPAAELDLAFQLLPGSDLADAEAARSPTLGNSASLPTTPSSCTIPAMMSLSLPVALADAAADPLAATRNPARPWEQEVPASTLPRPAPVVFKHAKLSARPTSSVPAPVEAIAPYLSVLTGLRSLDVSHNRLHDAAATFLAPALAALTSLTALNLTDNELSEHGIASVGQGAPHLLVLHAGFNKVYDRDVFGGALVRMRDLQHLSLAGNILAGSCGMLGSYLKLLTALTSLDLGEAGLGLDDLSTLGPAIHKMTALQELKLCRNRIAGCKGNFKEMIMHFKALRKLDLSGMCMGEKAAEELFPCLAEFRNLDVLDLRGNGTKVAGVGLPSCRSSVSILL
jgi:hypothetical protein